MPATTSESRDKLHSKLREVLGASHAGTLMGMLPPDSEQLATKADIEGLDRGLDGLDQRMDKLDQRMDKLDQRMDKLDQRMDKFDDRLWEIQETIRAQTRTYITAMVAAVIGVGGITVATTAALL